MKKIIIAFAVLLAMAGCEKEKSNRLEQDVNICLSYSLDTSIGENMTKSSNAEVWQLFYGKIKSGEFVAPSYKLTFTEQQTGQIYVFNGNWADNDMVTIKTGNYLVTGYSTADGKYIQEKASLSFNTEVSISAEQTHIVLPATYNCFLLAFAKSNITILQNHVKYASNMGGQSGTSSDFYVFADHYYVFSSKLYDSSYPEDCYIKGTRENGSTFTIYTKNIDFSKGKYYFYTDISSLYSLPEMEAGE